jgi:hypothetical protein
MVQGLPGSTTGIAQNDQVQAKTSAKKRIPIAFPQFHR